MGDPWIRKQGYLKRLKNLKKRYFVLRPISPTGKARLEYYENDKKFRAHSPPKRVIELSSCFSIAQKDDTKHKFVFVLYTREDVFGLIAESHHELTQWMDALLDEKEKNEAAPERVLQPEWNIVIKPRGLGTSKNLAGSCKLQLTNEAIQLISKAPGNPVTELQLNCIRRCGHTDCFFYMELGRSAATGAGEIWVQVEDPLLAQNMHEAILGSMHSMSGFEQTRARPQASTIKPRPTSLLFSTPPRTWSDTSPDSPTLPRARMGSASRDRHPSESDSPKATKPAVITRILSGSKKKSDDMAHSIPKGRRIQSRSLSVEPGHGSLLMRAQSADFSRMLSGVELPSLGSPNSVKEIDFEPIEPVRTMSNSSSSSGYSSGISWDTQVKTASPDNPDIAEAAEVIQIEKVEDTTKSECIVMESVNQEMQKRDEHQDTPSENKPEVTTAEGTPDKKVLTQRGRTGYEDMSGNIDTIIKEEEGAKRQPQLSDTLKSSPKQKRTSVSDVRADVRELVNFKGSQSIPVPKSNGSPRSQHQDYVTMSPLSIGHSYVNFKPGSMIEKHEGDIQNHENTVKNSGFEQESPYMNIGSLKTDSEEPSYMNFKPGESNSTLCRLDTSDYMNVKPAGSASDTGSSEGPNYVNFCPVSASPETTKKSGKQKKHSYENVSSDGILKLSKAHEEPEYMNIASRSPGRHKPIAPSRRSTGVIPRPQRASPRRRESEPAKGLSDEEAGLLFLDFSQRNKSQDEKKKEGNDKSLNYISLDLSHRGDSSPKARPPRIDLSSSRLHKHHSDLSPKSAPASSAYSEIDFTKSQGLRQARLEKEKPKS
ncbi:insulin receptor substrate 1-B isoform X2 [Nematostella vectensis]|uniref:insulin receptor substrate 1-B isoform X2 n=1 Tax=Nematostella vectensis TaxID=45351 RepID=UPI0020777EAC|nr:insulin receptor substrate 1-B isoform X2 [Nematostella vectensis]